jgi:hypothetical protein
MQPQVLIMSEPLKPSDLRDEAWREYDFTGRTYLIQNPVALYMRPGGTTHRVLDSKGIVHCVPAPGYFGCVLRWMPRADATSPVSF